MTVDEHARPYPPHVEEALAAAEQLMDERDDVSAIGIDADRELVIVVVATSELQAVRDRLRGLAVEVQSGEIHPASA